MANVVLCDDHQVLIEGQRRILERLGHVIVGVVVNGHELVSFMKSHVVDLAIVDINMPLLNGLEAIAAVREVAPSVRCIVMSMYDDPARVTRAFYLGAKGYITKSVTMEEFERAIGVVLSGGTYLSSDLTGSVMEESSQAIHEPQQYLGRPVLTQREREVLQLIGEGKSDKEIGAILNLTAATSRYHRDRIKRNFGCETTADLVKLAITEGLTDV